MTSVHEECAKPQSFVFPPTQTPLSQTSLMVQNLPSSHEVPFWDGTTTQVFIGPTSCPVLQTATRHGGVTNFEQSIPQGPRSPPLLLLLALLLLLLVAGNSPVAHARVHTSGSNSKTRRK